jgi:hypothetical protein
MSRAKSDVQNMPQSSNSRRKFLGNMGLVGAGALLASCSPSIAMAEVPTKADLDIAVLNFALNLEYLEAEFYLKAIGQTPSYATTGVGVEGPVMGGKKVTFTDSTQGDLVYEIARDEEAHVLFLREAIKSLGGVPVSRPTIDLTGAFAAAGEAASKGAIKGFDPYSAPLFFLHGAFVFEDVGVTAYKGAAPLLTRAGILEAAAGILAVEAYHAGAIRILLHQNREVVAAAGLNVAQIVGAISDLRDGADGTSDQDQGIVMDGRANIVPTDANGLTYSRNTSQVLSVVYLGGTDKGGFFPAGLNGGISKVVATDLMK